MSWVAVAIGGGAVLGAGASIYAANEASDAQSDAAGASNAVQRETRNMAYTANEPQRYTGYQALGDLNSLYGYGTSPYTPLNQLTGGSAGGYGGAGFGPQTANGLINVSTHTAGGRDTLVSSNADFLGMGGVFGHGGGYTYAGGTINPMTGEVTVTDRDPDEASLYNEALSNYLRTGEWTLNDRQTKYLSTVKSQIDKLRQSGWAWDAENNHPTGPGWDGAGSQGTQPGAPSMSKFFTSPDYTFRRDEGQRGIGNSFAARGGAASGNALRALSEFNSNLASGEFGNYFNRLSQMAGFGQVANQQNQQAGQYAANNISNGLMAQGDARASGIMGAANGVTGAINGGINSWLTNKYLNTMPVGQPTGMSAYGPYASGYRLPGSY